MAEIIKVAILFPLIIMALAQSTEGAEHAVHWIIPPSGEGASFYSSFASNTTFRLNDTLVFNFKTGTHDVVTLSKKNLESCNVNEKMESFETGPARITLNSTGEFFFACSFPSHCKLGQKLSINVTAASSSSSLAPPPAGSGAPVSVAVTFSVLLISMAFNVLF